MTKTLTEKWREGKLPENTYYVQFICGRYGIYEFEQFKGFGFDNDLAYIKEVLAPVPSYDKWKTMDDLLLIYKEENKRLKAVKEHCENIACQWADKLVDTERKVERLQERLEEAERFVKHDAYAEGLFGWVHTDRHGVVHENNLASKYCEKYGLEPEHYSMYNLHKFKKIIYKEKVARGCGIYTHPSIQMKSLGYKIKHEELKSVGERWLFWVDDYIEPMPEYLEKWGVK